MSARVWTVEELEDTWPVDGYVWCLNFDGNPYVAHATNPLVIAWVDKFGLLRSTDADSNRMVPVHVAAALVGVYQGRDSVETLAEHCEILARQFALTSTSEACRIDPNSGQRCIGSAKTATLIADMLRAGRVPT